METKDNRETSKIALANERYYKDNNFNFESCNEDEHNLEKFTKESTKQNRWTTSLQSEQNNIPDGGNDATEGDIDETDNW